MLKFLLLHNHRTILHIYLTVWLQCCSTVYQWQSPFAVLQPKLWLHQWESYWPQWSSGCAIYSILCQVSAYLGTYFTLCTCAWLFRCGCAKSVHSSWELYCSTGQWLSLHSDSVAYIYVCSFYFILSATFWLMQLTTCSYLLLFGPCVSCTAGAANRTRSDLRYSWSLTATAYKCS